MCTVDKVICMKHFHKSFLKSLFERYKKSLSSENHGGNISVLHHFQLRCMQDKVTFMLHIGKKPIDTMTVWSNRSSAAQFFSELSFPFKMES